MSLHDRERAIITGTAAPVSVLGRAAKNHARKELRRISESCITRNVGYAKVNIFGDLWMIEVKENVFSLVIRQKSLSLHNLCSSQILKYDR
jgi:hypothetical protein